MDWIKPKYSKGALDKAGKILASPVDDFDKYLDALEVVNNWRASHHYPLNTFKVTLRRYASNIDDDFLVAQRIKRLSSITHKLERFTTLRLSQMQDIGGCRAVLSNVSQVYELIKRYETSDLRHARDDVDDYIAKPKISGYRGIHLIYKYNSEKIADYNGLYIEIQIRSKLQHAWATAVETVGTFLNQPLKSSLGEVKWLRMFALMGSIIALREKSKVLVPDTPTTKAELVAELRTLVKELDVINSLQMFSTAINISQPGEKKDKHYFLLKLIPSQQQMTVSSFSRRQLDQATAAYLEVEKELKTQQGTDAVLVSADSLANLRRAYPNYFLDTQVFLNELSRAIAS